MGAAPTREAESIAYRRKSFRKKNSSSVANEPRGSAVGGTTNDSIAPARDHPFTVYNVYGTNAVSCLSNIDSSLGASGGSDRQTVRKRRDDPISGVCLDRCETHLLLENELERWFAGLVLSIRHGFPLGDLKAEGESAWNYQILMSVREY